MRVARWIWTLLCLGLALVGALVYGLPDGHYVGFGLWAVLVFFTVFAFIWVPGVLLLLAFELLRRAYRRARA